MGAAHDTMKVDFADEPPRIARSLRRGDPDALAELVERYQHRLFRYLLYLTGQKALAEDLFQETWLRVLERGRQYDGRSAFVPWLLAVARHLTFDHLRRRAPLSVDAFGRDDLDHHVPLSERPPSAFEDLRAREDHERLLGVLVSLPAIHREVLALRFQEDLTLSEIAALTGVPVPTVKSRLYRALESVRQLWGEAR